MTRMPVWTLILALSTVWGCANPIDSALGISSKALTTEPLIIDDFETGPVRLSTASGTLIERQPGGMIGGVREVVLSVTPHPFQQETTLTIMEHQDAGRLIISSGLQSSWGIYLIYGHGVAGAAVPLDLDLSGHNTIRLDFRSNDLPTSGAIELYEAGEYAIASWYADPSNNAFSVDIPFAAFTTSSGNPPPLEHVEQVVLLLQSGSSNAGNDLELASVSAQLTGV